ncbi:MAG TPA: ATP-dependent zinc metalloprotease FtsH, partial [Planctomycetota bacterium]|nr:ATP-dependent zinc metalloprotease FtsH [Planctomycetota bacterium]
LLQKDGEQTALGPRRFRLGLLYVVLLIIAVFSMKRLFDPEGVEASYDEFLTHLRAGHVVSVRLGDEYHNGILDIPALAAGTGPAPTARPAESGKDGASARDGLFSSQKVGGKLPAPGSDPFRFYVAAVKHDDLVKELEDAHQKHGTVFTQKPSEGLWSSVLMIFLPFLLIAGLFYLMMRQSGQVGRTALSFGKTRAKLYAEKVRTVTFEDVAGCEEAKEELKEVVDFLKDPKKYQRLGGRMPKGVLLVGPPGTGKTLLARAVAGESRTPFFSLSGSDFVEMFVGVGAARVRDLFQQAKHRAPCIVFVDELDAVGRHRGAGLGGGHDEREQTLNQLLVEMDGFDTTQGVIFLAATNRPDVLDPALLRPGRFDRQVVIDAPDAHGRKAILEVHARNKPFGRNIDFGLLAANTPGFTGADLANVINEAALLAARRGLNEIGKPELDEAVERAIAGPERKSRRLGEEERRRVAFHEAGHALVAALSKYADPVRKISIIPRGHAALGYTMQFPADDRYLMTRRALIDKLKGLLAGRAAEELVFDELSTGASDDLSRATQIARSMVCRFGMSETLGPATFGRESQQVFLGRDFTQEERNYSESTAVEIDREVRNILDETSREAKRILSDNRPCLTHIAQTLLEREVIQGSELDEMLKRELSALDQHLLGKEKPTAGVSPSAKAAEEIAR